MKHKVVFLSTIVMILLLANFMVHLRGCSLMFKQSDKEGNPMICCNKIGNCAFAGIYRWDGREESTTITIPDEWEGIPVIQIGGYCGRGLPTPFKIYMPKSHFNGEVVYSYSPEKCKISEPYTIEEIPFTLNLGGNISKIENVKDSYYPFTNEDGSITFYHPTVYIQCSELNKTFYSQDGKLYYKSNNKLVEGFNYTLD